VGKRFKRKPAAKLRELPDEQEVAKFAAGAVQRRSSATPKPWEAFDPKAKPSTGMNLRLNEYQLALLRYIAEAEDRSVQKTIKRLLILAAEQAAEDIATR